MLIYNRGQHFWGKKNQRTRIRRYVLCWTSLAVQCLRLCTSSAAGAGSIPGRGTKLPHAVGHSQNKKRRYVLRHAFSSPFRGCFRREGEAFPGGVCTWRQSAELGWVPRASVYEAFLSAAGESYHGNHGLWGKYSYHEKNLS